MSATLSEIVTLVDAELENHPTYGTAEVTGDGVTGAFLVSPIANQVIDDASFAVFIDGVSTDDYLMDFESGICTMNSTPTTAQTVSWQFNYVPWPESLTTQAVDAAVDNLFPAFYIRSNEVVTAGSEVECPEGTEFITGVDIGGVGAWKRLRQKRYDLIYDGGVPSLHFFTAPTGSVRIHYIARPLRFAASDDTLEDCGLPERASSPIVSYACYYLLSQKMAPRVRSDVAVTTQNSAALLPSQMQYGAQGYMMRFQFQMQSMRMPLWSS